MTVWYRSDPGLCQSGTGLAQVWSRGSGAHPELLPSGPLEDPGPGPDLDRGHSNMSESCVIKVGPGPEGGWPGRTRVGSWVMDVHSFNLVATATSPAREAAAARHHQLSQAGKSAFTIRAQRPLRPPGSGCRRLNASISGIFVWKISRSFFPGTLKSPRCPRVRNPGKNPRNNRQSDFTLTAFTGRSVGSSGSLTLGAPPWFIPVRYPGGGHGADSHCAWRTGQRRLRRTGGPGAPLGCCT